MDAQVGGKILDDKLCGRIGRKQYIKIRSRDNSHEEEEKKRVILMKHSKATF